MLISRQIFEVFLVECTPFSTFPITNRTQPKQNYEMFNVSETQVNLNARHSATTEKYFFIYGHKRKLEKHSEPLE